MARPGAAGGRLLVDVLDGAGGLVARHALDPASGRTEEVADDPAPVHAAQSFDTWQVDAGGAVYLPVTSAGGLAIVRVTR